MADGWSWYHGGPSNDGHYVEPEDDEDEPTLEDRADIAHDRAEERDAIS